MSLEWEWIFFPLSPWWVQDTAAFMPMPRMPSVSLSRQNFWGQRQTSVSVSSPCVQLSLRASILLISLTLSIYWFFHYPLDYTHCRNCCSQAWRIPAVMLRLLKPACSCMTAALTFLVGKFPSPSSWGCPLKTACLQKTRRCLPELCLLLTIDFQVSLLNLSFFISQLRVLPQSFPDLAKIRKCRNSSRSKAHVCSLYGRTFMCGPFCSATCCWCNRTTHTLCWSLF